METSFAERTLSSVGSRRLLRLAPPTVEAGGSLLDLCRQALRAPVGPPAGRRPQTRPVGAPSLAELGRTAARIAVIVSDASRDEPRAEMLEALLEVLPRDRILVVVAPGTHSANADVVPDIAARLPVIVHDASRLDAMTDLGQTERGTRVRILRDVASADLVVVTGRIRPHYFAGYSGGVKGLFPGCAYGPDILQNHLLKAEPGARLGEVDENPCRADMEEAALRVRGAVSILNVLSDCDGTPVAAASGHPIEAHRVLARQARGLFSVRAPRSAVVVVADRPPVTRSLYQASKLLPPAGAILEPGGTVIVVAECDQGVEPLERVNDGIYRLGVARQLPEGHRVVLVSALERDTVARTYAEPASSLHSALDDALGRAGQSAAGGARKLAGASSRVPVIWRAGEAIVEVA